MPETLFRETTALSALLVCHFGFFVLLIWLVFRFFLKKPSKEAKKALACLRAHGGALLESELKREVLGPLHATGEWICLQEELIKLGVVFLHGRAFLFS